MNNQKLKVLLVSPYNAKHIGGIGTWSKSILDYFNATDAPCEIVFQNTSNPIKVYLNGKRLRRLLIGTEDTAVILIKMFWNLLTKHPDVVHYTSSASWGLKKDKIALFITKTLFHKKFVIHWHFGRIPEICSSRNWEYKKIMKIIQSADASIVLDVKSLESLEMEGCKNVYNIPNPMTSAIYDATKDIDVQALSLKRIEGEVLFVGHIIKTKGVFELVKVCTEIQMVKKLIMVGPVLPDVREQLFYIAKQRDDGVWLEFKGELPREEVYKYYKSCEVFCLPSYTEGFPYVILEAMAFGCPIVATDVGAIAEMLQDGAGEVISAKSEYDLSKSLFKMLSDKDYCDDLGRKAYTRVMSVYTHDTIFEHYIKVWNLCLVNR